MAHFVWGVIPEDNGNPFNPDDSGVLILDDTFNMVHMESQQFMTLFCSYLREASFMSDSVV